jgi:UDP-glucose 4-epimerase
VDNFYNSKREALKRTADLSGKPVTFYECDIRDEKGLDEIFKAEKIDAVIHFAGLKAVGESCQKPLEYYDNNIAGTLVLCDVMKNNGCKKIVFSSSATVYGKPESVPIREDFPLSTTNPYGETKLMIERILKDLHASDPEFSVTILRYFNPIGAHESGLIGEDPKGIPNNLFPYITQVGQGKLPFLRVFGDDYATHDGTGVRDYIHVVDLARAHLAALDRARTVTGVEYYNVGTGNGYSVLDMVKAYEEVTGLTIPYQIVDRRPGDIDECYADPALAEKMLGWKAMYGLVDMCRDAHRWQSQNPDGYPDEE